MFYCFMIVEEVIGDVGGQYVVNMFGVQVFYCILGKQDFGVVDQCCQWFVYVVDCFKYCYYLCFIVDVCLQCCGFVVRCYNGIYYFGGGVNVVMVIDCYGIFFLCQQQCCCLVYVVVCVVNKSYFYIFFLKK